MLASSLAYSADGVETAVALEKDSFAPIYPAALVKDRVNGRVRVEFVVDSTGTLMWGTYSVVASSDRRFESAVRDALQLAQFTPALRAGRKVAQVVQMPVSFTPPDSTVLAR
jgi:TonB family protein